MRINRGSLRSNKRFLPAVILRTHHFLYASGKNMPKLLLYCRTKRLIASWDSGTATTRCGMLLVQVPTASNRPRPQTRRCPARGCCRTALPRYRRRPISSRRRRCRRRLATRSTFCELSCATSRDECDTLKSFFSTGSPTLATYERFDRRLLLL